MPHSSFQILSSVKVVATDTLKEPPMGQKNKQGLAKGHREKGSQKETYKPFTYAFLKIHLCLTLLLEKIRNFVYVCSIWRHMVKGM